MQILEFTYSGQSYSLTTDAKLANSEAADERRLRIPFSVNSTRMSGIHELSIGCERAPHCLPLKIIANAHRGTPMRLTQKHDCQMRSRRNSRERHLRRSRTVSWKSTNNPFCKERELLAANLRFTFTHRCTSTTEASNQCAHLWSTIEGQSSRPSYTKV